MFVYHVLSFVGGKSKTDGSAERRHALDKETMGAIFGKSRLAVCLKCLSRFVFEFTLQPLKKYILYEWISDIGKSHDSNNMVDLVVSFMPLHCLLHRI